MGSGPGRGLDRVISGAVESAAGAPFSYGDYYQKASYRLPSGRSTLLRVQDRRIAVCVHTRLRLFSPLKSGNRLYSHHVCILRIIQRLSSRERHHGWGSVFYCVSAASTANKCRACLWPSPRARQPLKSILLDVREGVT